MTQICINKVCFDFSIYHFIFLFLLVVVCNIVFDCFKSKKERIIEKLWNINYDIPEFNLYPGQYFTRSTIPGKKLQEYDELTKDYDRYDFTKPRVTNVKPSKNKSNDKQSKKKSSTDESSKKKPSKNRSSNRSLVDELSASEPLNPLQPNLTPSSGREVPNLNYPELPNGVGVTIPNGGLTDYELIKQRDLGVIANPLVPPEKRTERPTIDMTMPLIRNKYIGLPTRGSYDTYQNVGYLTKDGEPENVLKLFGRQKWPGSTQYEYYAIKSTAVDQFKVPMYHVRKQLFDGDSVRLEKVFAGNYKFMEFKQEELI